MEVKVTFLYLNETIQVICAEKDEMNVMFSKFTNKLNDGSDINHYIYYYEGNKLEHKSTIEKNKYIGHKKDIKITVTKKTRIVKCPRCVCNDCIINLDNCLATFYGCKYNDHTYTSTYDEYINIQKIDGSELRCFENGCSHNQQNYLLGFYKCLTCTNIVGTSQYFCKEHDTSHDEGHIRVKYDKKNYYCERHSKKFIKFCFTDKKIYVKIVKKSIQIIKFKTMNQ